MSKFAGIALAILVAAAALAAGLYWGGAARQGQPEQNAGALLLNSSFEQPGFGLRRMDSWRGKIMVVNFWASWCGPCREELPMLNRVHREVGPQGVQFVGLAIDSAQAVAEFEKILPIEFPVLIGNANTLELARALGNKAGGVPFTVILNRGGQVAAIHLGALNEAELKLLLKAAQTAA